MLKIKCVFDLKNERNVENKNKNKSLLEKMLFVLSASIVLVNILLQIINVLSGKGYLLLFLQLNLQQVLHLP